MRDGVKWQRRSARVGQPRAALTSREDIRAAWRRWSWDVWVEGVRRSGSYSFGDEGWGLCDDGERLIMSNGSDRLTFRDRETFDPVGEVAVTLRGAPLLALNELECVGDAVYANVYQQEFLVRIDPSTGRVTQFIDATGLLTREERRGTDVLNGIAYDPEADTFYITGKLWPLMFEVTFK